MFKPETFEEWLQSIHAKNYMGTDDDMPYCFERWISILDVNDFLELGQQYGTYLLETVKQKLECQNKTN